MFYSRCVCSVSALFLPYFFFFLVSESYYKIDGVSDSLRHLGIEDIECPVPGGWTVTIRDFQFCPFILTSLISGLGVSTYKWGWNFAFGRSIWNSELASLSFCVLLWSLFWKAEAARGRKVKPWKQVVPSVWPCGRTVLPVSEHHQLDISKGRTNRWKLGGQGSAPLPALLLNHIVSFVQVFCICKVVMITVMMMKAVTSVAQGSAEKLRGVWEKSYFSLAVCYLCI